MLLLLLGKRGKPRAIIEVKNNVYRAKKIENDIERIREVLKRKKSKSTIKFGLIAFFTSRTYDTKNSKQKVEDKMNSMLKEIKEQNTDINFEMSFRGNNIIEDDTNAWASVVILMTNP